MGKVRGVLGVALQSFFNLVVTYNILWFLSFPLSALGVFVLAYETSGHLRESFLAGWAFVFSAYHMAHSGHHLNLNSNTVHSMACLVIEKGRT